MKVFDVFGTLPDGKPLLIESVLDLTTAEQHAMRFSQLFMCACFVYSEEDARIVKRVEEVRQTDWAARQPYRRSV